MLKAFLIVVFIISGGAAKHPKVKQYLKRHPKLESFAWVLATIGGIYLVVGLFGDVDGALVWAYRRVTIGPYIDSEYSLASCDKKLGDECIRNGGVIGEPKALFRIRTCNKLEIIRSSEPSLQWHNLWITNVFSYSPDSTTPGGGLIDEVLKVGGWGDWYFSLIKFELPRRQEMSFAGVLLFVHPDEQETIPLFVDRIIEQWKWDLSQKHVWWRDRPGGFPIIPEALMPPQKNHWYVVEITTLYNQWVRGTAGNYGFQIRPATNYGSLSRFASSLAEDPTKIPHLAFCQQP